MMIPHYWYNINVDLPKPLPPPIDPYEVDSRIALLMRILPSELIDQEFTPLRYVSIPGEVRELYERMGRPTPFKRAYGLERALGNGVGFTISLRVHYRQVLIS